MGVLQRDGSKSEAKGDFAIRLDMMVEAGSNTGYVATVKRAIDLHERLDLTKLYGLVFVHITYYNLHDTFSAQVAKVAGCILLLYFSIQPIAILKYPYLNSIHGPEDCFNINFHYCNSILYIHCIYAYKIDF